MIKSSVRTSFEESKIKDALKGTHQWEDFKRHHWTFTATVLEMSQKILDISWLTRALARIDHLWHFFNA